MLDSIPLTARQFALTYGLSRERLARIVAISLREHSGVFGLVGLGYFVARMADARHMEIRPYTATRAEQEENPPFPIKGRLSPEADPAASATSIPAQSSPSDPPSDPASVSASDTPSKYELELRIMQERATALRQKNVLEQARLREETVAYCSAAIQLILTSLRSDIDSIRLDPPSAARLRLAIDHALADLNSVLPSIIDGTPVERLRLDLSARRADRLTASRTPESASQTSEQSPVDATAI